MQAYKKMVRQSRSPYRPERSQKTEDRGQKIKEICFLFSVFCPLVLSGCSSPPGQVSGPPQRIDQQPVLRSTAEGGQNISVAKRFHPPVADAGQGQTAVESAIELSQKYAKLSEQAGLLQRQNQDLIAENSQLKEQVANLDAKLKQTQKELTEANSLLIEMRIELNNWKADVLGFRDEMREAEITQLEALLKILKILGAEVTSPPVADASREPTESAQADHALAAEPGQHKSQETSNQDKTNE